jgi:putative DNA primase/helicase
MLLNARHVAATEASQQVHLHADQIKRMTGGDTMSARHVSEKVYVKRRPAFTPWIFTNQMPQISGRDAALDRRIRVIPFLVSLAKTGGEKTRRTEEMLSDQNTLETVFAWAIMGLKRYHSSGLVAPEVVGEYTREASSEMSDVDRYIHEWCETGDPEEYFEQPVHLYDAYLRWCERNRTSDRDRMSNTVFGSHLEGLNYTNKGKPARIPGVGPRRVRRGIRLNAAGREAVRVVHVVG